MNSPGNSPGLAQPTTPHRAASWLLDLGALRLALATLSVAVIALAPFSGGRTSYEGWALLTTIVAPAVFVIVAFLLPLDMLMTLVFRSDTDGAARARLSRAIMIEAVLFVLLIAAWYPFMNAMLSL